MEGVLFKALFVSKDSQRNCEEINFKENESCLSVWDGGTLNFLSKERKPEITKCRK